MVDASKPMRTDDVRPSSARTARTARLPGRLVLLFAVACGLVAANLYYAQPVLDAIAQSFHASAATAALVVTLSQVGYAVGLLFVVPLGDLLDRRRLVVGVLIGTAVALAAAAFAPSIGLLAGIALAIGVTSVVAQVLVPFAASLAGDAERGRVVGTVMSGLLVGILLARTVSGLIGQIAGWRTVYEVAALLMLGLIVVLWRELPREPRQQVSLAYGGLLRSVGRLVLEEPVLRRRSAYGALVFACFSVFWTSIAFLLSRPPFNYNEAIIGLFGLVGVTGALCASIAGRLADRGWTLLATLTFVLATLLSFVLLAWGGQHVLPLVAGVVLLDLGVQGTHITNQSEIYRLQPAARSRLTTAYMTTYFLGGALGSATSAYVFGKVGWWGVCVLGSAYAAAALALWVYEFASFRQLTHPRHASGALLGRDR